MRRSSLVNVAMYQRGTRYKVAVLLVVVIVIEVVYLRKRTTFHLSDFISRKERIRVTTPLSVQNRTALLSNLNTALSTVEEYSSQVDCKGIINGDNDLKTKAESWIFNADSRKSWMDKVTDSNNKCEAIKNHFVFADRPLSAEEFEFPLAYGMLVYKEPTQIYLMLSALYQPQNQFCIAVDDGADVEFKEKMDLLDECFPNIHVKYVKKVTWCGFSVIQAVYGCVKTLSSLKNNWKYYQYLSGVDLPLKTNLEMVRIFKKMNGSFNAEVTEYQRHRLKNKTEPPPVKLWKSSLSATFSRESADFMVHDEKVREVYEFLRNTDCADESFWTTIAGNPKEILMPGGFDAEQWFAKIRKEKLQRRKARNLTLNQDEAMGRYYISRMQTWSYGGAQCHGKFISSSCAYGVGDVPALLKAQELVAHKLYFDIQPAAYFCTYETVRKRALNGEDRDFTAEEYSKLPGPRLLAGDSINDVQIH
ncbi:hypothetical protein QR680_016356 [Steinernema hermaphroditum]|uniref:Uncharacterized protein n=1 Tax=Steinernema hermaphroditum TaxID=289476 RepID=A0AA39HBA5_9BILA|nr:hypothetical protein QR680_016356 [Steinernema hermaphroditum]